MIDRKLLDNFLSLSVLRFVTLIVPIITFPYLLRTLGEEKYGLIIWVWSITNLLVMLTKFGFDVTATKDIARAKDNLNSLSEITSIIYWCKITIAVFASFLFLVSICLIPALSSYFKLMLVSLMLIAGEAITPTWYFQGLERMRVTAILTSIVKVIFSILVLMLINKEDDYVYVMFLYGMASILSGLIASYIVFFHDKIQFKAYNFHSVKMFILNSFAVFMSNSLSVVRDSFTVILLEKYLGFGSVAIFDIVNRLFAILITPFHIFAAVLYPRFAVNRNYYFLFQCIFFSSIGALTISFGVMIFGEFITQSLGLNNFTQWSFFYVMMVCLPILNVASLMGTCGLAAIGCNVQLLISTFLSFVFYFLTIGILSFAIEKDLLLFALAVFVSGITEALVRWVFVVNSSKISK